MITLNTHSDHKLSEGYQKIMTISWCPQACLITTHITAKLIWALREHSSAFSPQMRASPGTREQACNCLMMWLSSPWRLAPLEFLRASNMFSASTVPSPSASNWAKAYKTREARKSGMYGFQILNNWHFLRPVIFAVIVVGRVQIYHSKNK